MASSSDIASAVTKLSPENAELFKKLCQNVLTSPSDPKFRRLKLSNAKIGGLCAEPDIGAGFQAMGWVPVENGAVLELPAAADLGKMKEVVDLAFGGEPITITVMRGVFRTKLELPPTARVAHLKLAIEQNAELGKMARGRQRLLAYYPPKPLHEGPQTLVELGIKSVQLEDEWQQLVNDMRESRVSFLRLAQALENPALRPLALVEQRDFVHERAVTMLRTRIVEVALEELQACRRCFEAVWPPSNPETLAERLALCASAAKSSINRREAEPGPPDLLGQSPLLEAMGMEVDEEPETHFVLEVDRSNLFLSTVEALSTPTPLEMRQLLQVRFKNEVAEDAGGLRREFFNEFGKACAEASEYWKLTPAGSLAPTGFVVQGGSSSSASELRKKAYRSAGRAFGLSLSQSSRPPRQPLLLGLPLARYFVRAVQGQFPESLQDLQNELNAEQHTNSPDFRGSANFCKTSLVEMGLEGQLTFSATLLSTGEVVDLIPSGRQRVVQDDDKEDWLRAVLHFEMVDSIQDAAAAFRAGVCDLVGASHLILLSAQELREAWSGRGSVTEEDLKVWQANTEVSPARQQQAKWLFDLLRGPLQEARPQVLKFATGSDRWPSDARGFRFVVEPRDGGDEALPSAMTCGNMLQLPCYSSPERLQTQLLKAVQNCTELHLA